MLPSIPEEQRSYLHHGGSLKSDVPHLAVRKLVDHLKVLIPRRI
jgi:hypothetical protein